MAVTVSIPDTDASFESKIDALTRELAQARGGLAEALRREAATAEVLEVISRSPTDVQPVFDTIVASAVSLCGARMGAVYRFDGELLHLVAHHNYGPEVLEELRRTHPRPPQADQVSGRAILARAVVQLEDTLADPHYRHEIALAGDWRSILAVPMLRNGAPIGVIVITRSEVGPFSNGHIELLKTFTDQAVIAIENTRLFEAEQARTRELTESLEYQTATSNVLNVISRSKFDLQPVLDVVAENAARVCGASGAVLYRESGGALRAVARYGDHIVSDAANRDGVALTRGTVSGRAFLDKRTIHVADLAAELESEFPDARIYQQQSGHRTTLATPLLRDGDPLGVILIRRKVVQPFTRQEIQLLETFADQAVIAIENTRLFEEVQQKNQALTDSNAQLAEALEQQTATSEILRVISSSPADIRPVLDAVGENAARLCDANNAVVYKLDGGLLRQMASYGGLPTTSHPAAGLPVDRDRVTGRAVFDRRTIHVHNLATEDAEFPQGSKDARRDGHRTTLATPLLREGVPLGAILIRRMEVRPFSERQIKLLETFADQAAIAIENTRLFEEVQARTREVTEALEQQTATSEVLSVISSSPGELEPVFQAMLQNATRICEAKFGILSRSEGDAFRVVALHGVPPAFAEERRSSPVLPPNPGTALGRVAATKQTVQIADVQAEPAYRSDPLRPALLDLAGARTVVAVPMLKENELVGAIVIYRQEVRPFTDKQIALVTSFARQAVIAIENARLLDELQSRTRELARSVEELKALGEVSQAVNSSLDLETVLNAILAHACQMSETGGGAIYVFDEAKGEYVLEAGHNMGEELVAAVRAQHMRRGTPVIGECVEQCATVQVPDLALTDGFPLFDVLRRGGIKALLSVPLLHHDKAIGALLVRRMSTGAFAPETVRLLQSFATQSSLAIHNARLFHEIEEKGRQLEIASQHKSQFVANMSHELRTPLAAMLGYAELLQEGIYGALPEKAPQVLARIQSNGKHLLGLINTVLDISKIESGQFKLNLSEYALSSMVETVRVATESLAAGKKLAFHAEVAKGLPHGLGDEQRLTQVLLNLVGNAIKFTDTGEVRIRASVADGRFTVAVSDTGPGIPPEERDRVFEKFHQIDNSSTRTKGGTGLGLAIAKDIVEMHGGRIWVESTLGKGATFHLELPVRAKPSEASAA